VVVWKIEVFCDADFDGSWELVALVESKELALKTLENKREAIRASDDDRAMDRPSDVWDDGVSLNLHWWNRTWRASQETVHNGTPEIS